MVPELDTIQSEYPISKYSVSTEWIFIKTFVGSYDEALKEAAKLQSEDPEFQYRIYDDRDD